jgi:hypothetical protein
VRKVNRKKAVAAPFDISKKEFVHGISMKVEKAPESPHEKLVLKNKKLFP